MIQNIKIANIKSTDITISKTRYKEARKMWMLYLFLLFPIAHTIIFHYMPMYGVVIAFKDFKPVKGILGSEWNNFRHFKDLFTSTGFFRVVTNTLKISFLRLAFGFPAPIVLALLLNEIWHVRFKKIVQTISYLPVFMSWIVLAGVFFEFLSVQRGPINYLIKVLGGQPIDFFTDKRLFVIMLILTGIWQGVGWSAVIYLASLSSVNPELYESAELDGANRFHKAVHISLPSLTPVITILFILNLGGILDAGFDQIFNMSNPLVMEVADIIDTYVYRMGLLNAEYDFSAAVGLFKNVVGLILIIITNTLVSRISDYGVW
ncbi:MAG TPA: ABC transporter permease subunit [Clostridiales bacterium]|nr:ABC transporter permease subunit [Clostridiales bacterium]